MAGAFFATLECELFDRRRFCSQAAARMAVFQCIGSFDNPARRHSSQGYVPPIEYEATDMAVTDGSLPDNHPLIQGNCSIEYTACRIQHPPTGTDLSIGLDRDFAIARGADRPLCQHDAN